MKFMLRRKKGKIWGWINHNIVDRIISGVQTITAFATQTFNSLSNKAKNIYNQVVSTVKGGIRTATDWTQDIFNDMVNWLKNLPSVLFNALQNVWAHIQNLINTIIYFFGADNLNGVGEFIKCFQDKGLPGAALEVKDMVSGYITTFRQISEAITLAMTVGNVPGLVFTIIDLIVALICNFSKFKLMTNHIMAAVNAKDTNSRLLEIGQSIGLLVNAIGTAKTVPRRRKNKF